MVKATVKHKTMLLEQNIVCHSANVSAIHTRTCQTKIKYVAIGVPAINIVTLRLMPNNWWLVYKNIVNQLYHQFQTVKTSNHK